METIGRRDCAPDDDGIYFCGICSALWSLHIRFISAVISFTIATAATAVGVCTVRATISRVTGVKKKFQV